MLFYKNNCHHVASILSSTGFLQDSRVGSCPIDFDREIVKLKGLWCGKLCDFSLNYFQLVLPGFWERKPLLCCSKDDFFHKGTKNKQLWVNWHKNLILTHTVPCKCKLKVPRNSNFTTRSSVLEIFEYRGSGRVHRVSSQVHRVSRQGNKELFAWLVFYTPDGCDYG